MAKDQIGELGLDVKDIIAALGKVNDSLDKLTSATDKADKKIKGGFTESIKGLAKAFGLAFGAAQIGRYVAGLRNVGGQVDDLRSKLLDGSKDAKDFNAAIQGNASGTAAASRLGRAWDRFKVKLGVGTASILSDMGQAWNASGAMAGGKGFEGKKNADNEQNRIDQKTDKTKREILKSEDELASVQSYSLNTQADRLALLDEELRLQQKRIAIIDKDPSVFDDPRGARNAAMAAMGAIKAEQESIAYATEKEAKAAKAVTQEMELQLKGMSGAAKETALRVKYEQAIAQALRDGKTELANQLQIQKKLSIEQGRVNEHNMTNDERRAERRVARKYGRDLKKTNLHDADLARRLEQSEREGHAPTPGSELDRYRSRRNAERAANGKAANAPDPASAPVVAAIAKTETILSQIEKNTQGMFKNKP